MWDERLMNRSYYQQIWNLLKLESSYWIGGSCKSMLLTLLPIHPQGPLFHLDVVVFCY